VTAVPLSRGEIAQVDDSDAGRALAHKWHFLRIGYAARSTTVAGARKIILLHRFLTDAPAGMYVDHINGDKLDNRRSNLRICTPHESIGNVPPRNGRQVKGVMHDQRTHKGRKWSAYIRLAGRTVILGRFTTEAEAARAYDKAALKYFGAFAWLNFPPVEHRQNQKQAGRPAMRRTA